MCIHCGEGGSNSYGLGLSELQVQCLTDGYICFPIRVTCIDGGNEMKNETQARKECIAKANKGKK